MVFMLSLICIHISCGLEAYLCLNWNLETEEVFCLVYSSHCMNNTETKTTTKKIIIKTNTLVNKVKAQISMQSLYLFSLLESSAICFGLQMYCSRYSCTLCSVHLEHCRHSEMISSRKTIE